MPGPTPRQTLVFAYITTVMTHVVELRFIPLKLKVFHLVPQEILIFELKEVRP